jgi:hypothetical protein
MKFQNIALILLTLFSISAHAAPINCTVPNGSGHRYALTGGGYGFCQVETCANPTDEVYKNQCLSAPKVSFLQSNSLVTGSERQMIIKATLTRPSVSGAHVNLSSSASSASLADFQLISAQAQFLAGSTVSEPIIIQLHNNNSSQPNRTISISFANDGSASGLSTTSASPIVIAIADTPAALQPIVAQIKSPSDQSLPASMESSVGSVPMKLTLSSKFRNASGKGSVNFFLSPSSGSYIIPANPIGFSSWLWNQCGSYYRIKSTSASTTSLWHVPDHFPWP